MTNDATFIAVGWLCLVLAVCRVAWSIDRMVNRGPDSLNGLRRRARAASGHVRRLARDSLAIRRHWTKELRRRAEAEQRVRAAQRRLEEAKGTTRLLVTLSERRVVGRDVPWAITVVHGEGGADLDFMVWESSAARARQRVERRYPADDGFTVLDVRKLDDVPLSA
ncbi:MAG TPA: hypothetical protein VEY95_11515 [Azospirillaceae bacterium]|nr:hypothetical protein [Azospirillaceae bacterium]